MNSDLAKCGQICGSGLEMDPAGSEHCESSAPIVSFDVKLEMQRCSPGPCSLNLNLAG